MKTDLVILLASLFLTTSLLSACKKDKGKKDEEPEAPAYALNFYRPSQASDGQQLQSSLLSGNMQLLSFGAFDETGKPQPSKSLLILEKGAEEEGVVLFSEDKEPAFVYQIDAETGLKKPSVVEFEKLSDHSFYMRIYHYDWTNRLGTLLFETLIEEANGNTTSSPIFTISQPDLQNLTGKVRPGFVSNYRKTNRGFSKPLPRLRSLMSSGKIMQTKASDIPRVSIDAVESFKQDFDQFRNSDISRMLGDLSKGGNILIAAGITAALISSPVTGSLFVLAGAALSYPALVNNILISDNYTNMIKEVTRRADEVGQFAGRAMQIGNNTVSSFSGYDFSLPLHIMEGFDDDFANLSTWMDNIVELTVENVALDDLPDSEGVLQFGLSWNTNATDIDLWVTEPSGNVIYFDNPQSDTGGYLDRDDTDGYGPENIYFMDNIPNGKYLVQVHYYDPESGPSTNYTVKVTNGLGFSKTYQGTLAGMDELDNVVTIVKSASSISIQ